MTLFAIEHIKAIRSGEMRAQLFRCSDGKNYIVKFMSNPLGKKALFNELISYRLGKLLNLPIPEGVVVYFSKNKLKNPGLIDKFKIKEGPHFGCLFLEPSLRFDQSKLPLCTNISIAPMMIVFDYWISNFDRARQPSNLLMVGSQNQSLALIDHADAFRNPNWNIPFLLSRIDNLEVSWGEVYQAFVPYIDQKQPFQTALEQLDSLTNEQIAKVVGQEIPKEWHVSKDELTVLLFYLIKRKEKMGKILSQLKGFFPIWSSVD